jgi:hypothetical protein
MHSTRSILLAAFTAGLAACQGTPGVSQGGQDVTAQTPPHIMTLLPGPTAVADNSPYVDGTDGANTTGQDPTKGLQPNPGTSTPSLSMSGGASGALLKSAVIYTIYYGDYWSTTQGASDMQFNDGFAQAIGKSPIEGVIAEYNVGPSTFGSSSVVAHTFKTGENFTDAQAQQVVQAELTAGHVSRQAQGIYTVIAPPGVVVDTGGGLSTDGIGGYHMVFTGTDKKPVYYSVIVNSDSNGNGIDFNGNHLDAVTITESHEWVEAETDPDISSGWHDANTGGELGDVGIWDLDKQLSNNTFDMSRCWARQTDGYAYQEEWSMHDKQFEVQPGATPGN